MNSKMELCYRNDNRKSSEFSHTLYHRESDVLFDATQCSENHTSNSEIDTRDANNNMGHAYGLGENTQTCRSSQPSINLRVHTSSVPGFQFRSDQGYDNLRVLEGFQVEYGSMLNTVKSDVMNPEITNESCAKYRAKIMGTRGFVKAQAHYNIDGNEEELKKGCERGDALGAQVDKHDASSFGCREYCDEDGTSHVDEEETLDSSEPSATRQTPLLFMYNNAKLREWMKSDLDGVSFSEDGRGIKAQRTKECKLSSDRKRTKNKLGPYCVILPRAHGVNTKLLRTADICQHSLTRFVTLPSSIKDEQKNSNLFPLRKHQLSLFEEAQKALEGSLFQTVKLELHGTSAGGTYMVHYLPSVDVNDGKMVPGGVGQPILAVFKPRDEEIGQQNNPHGNFRSDREGFAPGSGSRREVLAYCLDHDHFAGIPPTLEVSAVYCLDASQENAMRPNLSETMVPSVRIGSLQLFVPNCIDAADVLPGKFLVEEVHALAIFDIRTLNSDRHGGNVLVRYGDDGDWRAAEPHLVPIDHSYVCPSGYADPDYEWLSWTQSKVPFSLETLDYIQKLDASADADLVAAALSANGASYMGTSSPRRRSLPNNFENDISTATSQEVLQVRNKQWMIEDLWVMSSPLHQRRATSCAYAGSSHPDYPKFPKEYPSEQRDVEDVRAAANTLYCATRLLQVAALEFGLTAYDIGNMCRRPRLTCPSLLEELIEGSLDEKTWETDRGVFELLLIERLEAATASILEK